MQQVVIALNFTGYGLEFTSPVIDIYAPWLTLGISLVIAGVIGTVHAVKMLKGKKCN